MSLSFTESGGFLLPKDGNQSLVSESPWEQAEAWCRDLLLKDKECIVLGLGGGFHIAELFKGKNLERVYVVDRRPGLVNIFRKQFPEIAERTEIIILEDASSLLKHEIMELASSRYLSTLAFVPSWPKNDTVFRTMHRHLTGRSPEALHMFLKKHGFNKDIRIVDEGGAKYLSLKDIEVLIQEDVPPHLRINCFRVLKELIL